MMLVVTLGQQYNAGEKPTVILHTLIALQGHQPDYTSNTKQKQCSTSSYMVVIIYCSYIGYKDKAFLCSSFFFRVGNQCAECEKQQQQQQHQPIGLQPHPVKYYLLLAEAQLQLHTAVNINAVFKGKIT